MMLQPSHDGDDRSPLQPADRAASSSMAPAVDAAIERLIASMPLRRPSPAFVTRMEVLLERRSQPWWQRLAPLAVAALFALAVGFVAGGWFTQLRLQSGPSTTQPIGALAGAPDRDFSDSALVLQESSVRPAALAQPRSLDLGDDGLVQTAPSLWIRTDRFHDPRRGVTVERSYPETWTLVGAPATD